MRVLIVKTSAIGDIIHAFPVAEYLKSRFPEAEIDWAVEKNYQELVAAHPLVSDVIVLSTQTWRRALHRMATWREIAGFRKELRGKKYDLLFDLQGNTKSAVVTAFADAHEKIGFGPASVAERPNLWATHKKYEVPSGENIQQTYLKLVQAHFNDAMPFLPQHPDLRITKEEETVLEQMVRQDGPRYLVAFGSNWPNKQLSEESWIRFLQLVEEKDHPFFYFIWGSGQEKEQADRLHAHFKKSAVVDRLRLPLLQGLMRKMDLVISVDSMALHLCGKTPSFSLFGPSLASVYAPLGPQHASFQGECPYGRVFSKRCPVLRTCPTGACLKQLTAEELFERFLECV
jgi:heptosyltransferase-1